ncbi:MAG: type II toxin-antitoxin system ParD family antitoxin [Phreatobacter sp.]|uniref:type II toxin-antitoxin system ParD family antitoxin n=1 Tax=Phreatobacter sp. TaxID=1966341 RepID=UPI001A5A1CA2|nr:type II toxin-antitoxin system ParD family antitoxin [Phreatobacter sp.]MBL8568300.1 type II toxin-antitoxin system ParD family antitoxin [Phreatobacter sp.]
MATRNISLTAEQDAFIDEVVGTGDYQNASEAVRDALRLLRSRREEDALRLEGLRRQLQMGIDAIERGDVIALDDDDIGAFLSRLSSSERAG